MSLFRYRFEPECFVSFTWTEATTPNGPDSQPGLSDGSAAKDEEEGSDDEWEQVGPRNKTSITRQTDFIRTPITDIFGGHIRLGLTPMPHHASCLFPSHHSMALASSVAGLWKVGGDGVLCKSSILRSHAKKNWSALLLFEQQHLIFCLFFFESNWRTTGLAAPMSIFLLALAAVFLVGAWELGRVHGREWCHPLL